MVSQAVNDDVALRIGLVARALPDVDAKSFVSVVISAVGQPITTSKLSKLRLNRLKQAGNGVLDIVDEHDLKRALSFLKGRGIKLEAEPLPEVSAYQPGDMPGSIRVACSSDNGDKIDGHFGSCERFLIYQVAADEIRLIEIRTIPEIDPEADKNKHRAELINDCHVLCTTSIGGPAAAKVIREGLHPIKLKAAAPADEYIAELQTVLKVSPPPWLAKVMGEKPEQRVRFNQEAAS